MQYGVPSGGDIFIPFIVILLVVILISTWFYGIKVVVRNKEVRKNIITGKAFSFLLFIMTVLASAAVFIEWMNGRFRDSNTNQLLIFISSALMGGSGQFIAFFRNGRMFPISAGCAVLSLLLMFCTRWMTNISSYFLGLILLLSVVSLLVAILPEIYFLVTRHRGKGYDKGGRE